MAQSALTPDREVFSVLTAFSDYSDDQLLTLLAARPDLASPPPRDLPSLAARAGSWSSIDTCLSTLNRPGKQLLDALCLLPQPTTVAALSQLLATDVDGDALDAALRHLANLALIFRQGPELRLHPQILSRPNPAGLGPPLSVALSTQQKPTLDALARRYRAKPGTTKADTMALLIRILRDPNRLAEVLADAPESTPALAAQLAEYGIGSVPSGTYNIRPQSPLGWLGERGLIFATDWDTVVMPREVALAFRGGRPFPDFSLAPPTVHWHPVDADAVERASTDQALTVVADIVTILESWEDASPKLLKAGGIGVRALRRSATAVGRSETETARLIELAAVAGLAGWDDESATARPCPAYDRWLELPVADRWVALVTSWLAADFHVSLAGATGTNGKPVPPLLPPFSQHPVRHQRRLVLAALLEGEGGQAPDGESLAARVRWDAPAVWSDGPASPVTLIAWVREEAAMLGLCAFGTLSTLGREMVTGQVDRARATLDACVPAVTSEFVLQADLTVVATGPLATAVRADLELMADLESSGAATVFRVSEHSLRRAYDAGWTPDEITGFLHAHATKGVPQPLVYLVDDVGRRHGRARVGSATSYIRSDDPSLLAEILVTRKAAKLGLHQVAPTVLVSNADPTTVVETLRATGFLPAEEDVTGGLLIRRREVQRATEGHGPLSARTFDHEAGQMARARAAALSTLLARSESGAPPARGSGARQGDGQQDLRELVRRLRAPGPSRGSGRQPSTAGARPENVPLANDWLAASLPFSQFESSIPDQDRPVAIARSRIDILELLDDALEYGWLVRIEYFDPHGQNELLNAEVFRTDGAHVVIAPVPGGGPRILTVTRISWARALTEAEEEAL
jgi:hypothetical protein